MNLKEKIELFLRLVKSSYMRTFSKFSDLYEDWESDFVLSISPSLPYDEYKKELLKSLRIAQKTYSQSHKD